MVQSAEEMKENERAILESFSKPEYVQQLIHYLALEEHKGQDKFRSKHLTLFKVCRFSATFQMQQVKTVPLCECFGCYLLCLSTGAFP